MDAARTTQSWTNNPKRRLNRREYLLALERMGPERRSLKALELTELARASLRDGIKRIFPDLGDSERHEIYLKRLKQCHNRNY